jgi:predicted transcriptional regulator
MKQKGFNIEKIVQIAEKNASELSIDNFCNILNNLPPYYEFNLNGISEELNGNWVKGHLGINGPEEGQRNVIWHNLTNDAYCLSPSFYEFSREVINAIISHEKTKRPIVFNLVTSKIGLEGADKKTLKDLYHKQGKSLEDIGKEYNTSRVTIQKRMKRCGLVRRRKSEARLEAIKQGKFEGVEYDEINEKFFRKWSPGMAWVLGLLFTDGYVQKGIGGRVGICSIDMDLLTKVRKLLGSTRQIAKRSQSYDKSKHINYFEFYRENMRQDLEKLGLHPNKSLNMIFPVMPEEYTRHFIRGCWDGDGSVFVSGGRLNASYVTGSRKFIERVVEELYKAGIHKRKPPKDKQEAYKMWNAFPDGKFPLKIHKKEGANAYNIKLDAAENIDKLFRYFYEDIGESMYLKRKYDVFVKALNINEKIKDSKLTLDLPV